MKATIDDKCQLEVTIKPNGGRGESDGITLKLDLFAIFETMDDEAKLKVAEALTWKVVLQEAVRRLTGKAESWAGDDIKLSAEVLKEMHEHAVGAPVWFWGLFKKLEEYARDLEHREALYWELYHDRSPKPTNFPGGQPLETMGDVFQAWCDRVPSRRSSNIMNHSDRFETFKKEVFDTIHGESKRLAEQGAGSEPDVAGRQITDES